MGNSSSKAPTTSRCAQFKCARGDLVDKSRQGWDDSKKRSKSFASDTSQGIPDEFLVAPASSRPKFLPFGRWSFSGSENGDAPPMYEQDDPSHVVHEDALELLKQFDTVILLDDSASMCGFRWNEAIKALADVAHEAGKYDANGIDIYLLNNQVEGKGMRDKDTVSKLLTGVRPKGLTPLAARLEGLMKKYMDDLENAANPDDIKPINYIVITDGEPTDDPESVIRAVAKRLDSKHWPLCQLGIQLIQIGGNPRATRYLQSLDDDLKGIRDIVDTTPYPGHGQLTAATIIKILLGGINRRVDHKGGAILLPP